MPATLRQIERRRTEFGAGVADRKLDLLRELDRATLSSARAVHRLHEVLCFLRAYPDDARVLGQVEAMLARFAQRRDLRRHAEGLAGSGIAGTPIRYPFFAHTARWLARRWPAHLTIDWDATGDADALERSLHLLALYAETPGLDEVALPVPDWIDRLKGAGETDAAFLVARLEALRLDPFVYDRVWEDLELTLRLGPGPDTPSRTFAKVPGARVVYQARPLARTRPDLRAEVDRQPLGVRLVPPREGARYVDMAREAMVTRSRDLDAFAHGDARDVRVVDWEDGLQFAVIGVVPERRLLLEAVYAFLTLKNGVPIGYVLNSALYGSAEIAYNVFDAYRGVEAATVYARVLATVRHLFTTDAFTIYPYQLGDDNEEAIESGAFWFYQKLGFRPLDRGVLAVLARELRALAKRPAHRSSAATLRKLARENVYWFRGRLRRDVMGLLPLASIGLAVTDALAARFGKDRERATATCVAEVTRWCGAGAFAGMSSGERLALERWAPLAVILPGVGAWTAAERRALGRVIRAKGGRSEADFVRAFDRHSRLRSALLRLGARTEA
jgi:hypothetical protein